jgi:anti-sigma B factor antagonist
MSNHLDSLTVATAGDFDLRSESLPGGVHTVHVSGELDLATAPRLEEALADVSAQTLVIDLSGCTFLDSAGIRTLVGAARERSGAGSTLSVVTADPGILRLLEITAVDTLIHVHPSLDEAL